jgi:hypothetical protein
LLANAGCSTGYFDDLARVLAAGGLQTISVNMRGAGESRGSLDGITVHDLPPMWLRSSKLWIAVRHTSSAMPREEPKCRAMTTHLWIDFSRLVRGKRDQEPRTPAERAAA